MPSILLKTQCPSPGCKGYNSRKIVQWAKADCGHRSKIDTDVDVFCEQGCSWPGSSSSYCNMIKLYWKCSECKAYSKPSPSALAASYMRAAAAMIKAKSYYSNETDLDCLAAIMDKMADLM